MIKKLLVALLFLGLLGSCVPTERLTYLQQKETKQEYYDLKRPDYRVQPNDILSISIKSFDLETNLLFNRTSPNQQNALQAGDILFYLQGYSLDLEGNITLPVIGELKVLNLTISQIDSLIESELNRYFVEEEAVFVSVQLSGVRYSVVGEVNLPGKYVIYQNQVNIFEALAEAGDISVVGDRENVMIVRQGSSGATTHFLDLTDVNVINSPYYFIQPNDIINIQPLPQKSLGIGTTGFQTFTQLFSVVASTITLIIALNSLNQG